jgi:hypothetical protein
MVTILTEAISNSKDGLDTTGSALRKPSTVAATRRRMALVALFSGWRPLVVIAAVFLVLGSALGYGMGAATVPRPLSPDPAVASYMAGLQRMDGAELWASMSPDMRAQAQRAGDTETSFVDFYRQLKARGNRIDQVQYVGGYQTKEKGLFIYVTRRLDPGKEPLEVIWVLVTGPEGLIDYVL